MKLKLRGLNMVQFFIRFLSGMMIAGWLLQEQMVIFTREVVRGDERWAPYAFALFQAGFQVILTWFFVKYKITPMDQAENEDVISILPCLVPLFFPVSRQLLGVAVAITGIIDIGQAYGLWVVLAKTAKRTRIPPPKRVTPQPPVQGKPVEGPQEPRTAIVFYAKPEVLPKVKETILLPLNMGTQDIKSAGGDNLWRISFPSKVVRGIVDALKGIEGVSDINLA